MGAGAVREQPSPIFGEGSQIKRIIWRGRFRAAPENSIARFLRFGHFASRSQPTGMPLIWNEATDVRARRPAGETQVGRHRGACGSIISGLLSHSHDEALEIGHLYSNEEIFRSLKSEMPAEFACHSWARRSSEQSS